MALYKYHYIELDTKRSPRISLQNIVAGETGNVFWITFSNNNEIVDMSEKSDGEFLYRVSLRIRSNLGVRRQDSDDPDGGITFIEAQTGDHGKIHILLSADAYTSGKNRCVLEIYSKRVEEDDTLICSAEWTFDAEENPTGENKGLVYPMMAYYEQLAKSWATGGTGRREGEDTDNAAFYAQIARDLFDHQVVVPSILEWLYANIDTFKNALSADAAAWLSAHITNPSNPAIDTSLSVSGAAADAKETGLTKQMIMLPFDPDNEHYALECIHHDNFNRTPESEYDVGQNGNAIVPMTYKFNTDINNAYKIVDNVLTFNASGTTTKGMFLVNKPTRNFVVNLGLIRPTTSSYIAASFAWNFVDSNNFSAIYLRRNISNNKLNCSLYSYTKVSGSATNTLLTNNVCADMITLAFVNNALQIYESGAFIASVANVSVDCSKDMGLYYLPTSSATYMWKSFDVFNIAHARCIDEGIQTDKADFDTNSSGYLETAATTQAIAGRKSSVLTYLLNRDDTVTRFSPYSECFELRYIEEGATAADDSRRTELSIKSKPYGTLFRAKVSFDFALPSDYQPETDPAVAATDFEIIAQFKLDGSTDGNVSYNPTPCLKIMNGDLVMSQWGQPEQNKNVDAHGEYAKVETRLKTLTPGQWYHIDLYVRSGYEISHNPLVELMIDGELVYRSRRLNCPNSVGNVTFHYGIYKSQWYIRDPRMVGNVRGKKYYFDNVKVRWF